MFQDQRDISNVVVVVPTRLYVCSDRSVLCLTRLNIRHDHFQIVVSIFNRGNDVTLIWLMRSSSFPLANSNLLNWPIRTLPDVSVIQKGFRHINSPVVNVQIF